MEKIGFIYNFGDINDFEKKLDIVKDINIYELKKNCLKQAEKYKEEVVIQILLDELDKTRNI